MEPTVSSRPSLRRSLRWSVVAAAAAAVVVLAGLVTMRRMESMEHSLHRALVSLEHRGRKLGIEGCVDAALRWRRQCPSVAELCDAGVGRLVAACLQGGGLEALCARLGDRPSTTHFGFRECKARRLPRPLRTACAEAYRAVARVCRRVQSREAGR